MNINEDQVQVCFVGYLNQLPREAKKSFAYAMDNRLLPTDEKMVILRDAYPHSNNARYEFIEGEWVRTQVSSEFSWYPLNQLDKYSTESDRKKIAELMK